MWRLFFIFVPFLHKVVYTISPTYLRLSSIVDSHPTCAWNILFSCVAPLGYIFWARIWMGFIRILWKNDTFDNQLQICFTYTSISWLMPQTSRVRLGTGNPCPHLWKIVVPKGVLMFLFFGGEGVKALYILKFTIGSNKKMIHLIIDFKYVLLTEVLVGLCPQTSRVRLGTGNPCPIFF